MKEEIIVALIALIGTLISGFITARITRDKVMNELKIQNEVQNTKLEYIKEELNKVNQTINKISILESKIEVLEEKVKVANKRISDLENGK